MLSFVFEMYMSLNRFVWKKLENIRVSSTNARNSKWIYNKEMATYSALKHML